jgi:hypothetical protein
VIRPAAASHRLPGPRPILFGLAAILVAAAALSAVAPPGTHASVVPPTLAERLGPHTYALAIPVAWLAAPLAGLHEDDVLDILGTRAGERATASDVASGLRVMAADDRTLVVELTGEGASAIAAARARGLSLIPILRSAR